MPPCYRILPTLFLATLPLWGAEAAAPPFEPALQRFSQSLTFRTVSRAQPEPAEPAEFARFHAFLRQAFPRVHRRLECRVVGRASLLYRWPGSRPSLRPLLLLAHQDVVAVDPATEGQWRHPPFSGAVADGFVWGRGARDFKPGLMAILESAEWLLGQGFVPEREIRFAFGDDEEVQGYGGAAAIARELAAAGVRPEFILDEGGGVGVGTVGGIASHRPVAIISVAEKGYLGVNLTVRGAGGHAALGDGGNPILILAEALRRIQQKPFPAQLQEPVPAMLQSLGQGMGFWRRFAFRNLWLTGGLAKRALLGQPESAGMLRTTVAVTRFDGGLQDNVVPGEATAVLNLRLLPGWTVARAMAHLAEAIGDPRVALSVRGTASEAPPLAPVTTPGYALLASVIRKTFPGALVAPALVAGTTDIRHYAPLTANLYRFAPSVSTRTFTGNGHQVDERLPVANYRQYLGFYSTLLQAGAKALDQADKH